MSILNYTLPTIGNPNATEDPIVRTALSAIQTDYNGNITNANLANNTVTAAKIEVQQAWQVLSLGTAGNLSYYKDSLGHVWWSPAANTLGTGAGWGASQTLATMPAGYRPGFNCSFEVLIGGAAYRILVNSNGDIVSTGVQGGGQSWEAVGNVHYRAA